MTRWLALAAVVLLQACAAEEVSDPEPFFSTKKADDQEDATQQDNQDLPVVGEGEGEGEDRGPTPPGSSTGVKPPTTPTTTTPAPPTATVKLDGVVQKVGEIRLWAPNDKGEANVFINFTGTGAVAGTDVNITFVKVAKGCVASPKPKPQDIWFRPGNLGDQYHSPDGTTCGLDITSFPAKVGDKAKGTFKGKVNGINGAAGKTKTLEITFDATRAK